MKNNNSENPNIPQELLIEKNRRIVTNANDPNNIEKIEIRDQSQQDQFEEFDGLVHLDLDMLLPKSYFDAIDELSERIGMTVKEWINYATIKEINALRGLSNHYLYSPVTNAFLSKYNIGQLKDTTIQHIVKRYANFSMEEVELKR